ncbi:MAG: ABC transporter substrate-binding protein [Eubacterium sp.]|nr:ABC transporter substrate-binding protein [Eubacterium sp.]
MKFNKLLAVILAAVFAISFVSCSKSVNDKDTANTDNNTEKTKITFCLDWTPNTNHTGLYVAVDKGYYDEAGLDVTIVQPPENSAASQVCASGQAQFTIEAQDTLAAAFTSDTPLGLTAVAAILQHNTSGIISKAGQGMDTPKGLTGKTYLTWDSPIELAVMEHVVNADGGKWEDVKLIPNTVTDEAQDVNANPDHAIWVFYGWGGINAEVNNIDIDYFYFKDIDKTFDYYTPVIIANNDFLSSNPETVKAFLEATKKGYEYAAENPEEAANILIASDDTGSLVGSEKLVVESQKWISQQYIADASQWGYIEPQRWDGFYAWLWDNKLIEKELPSGTGFSNDYLS